MLDYNLRTPARITAQILDDFCKGTPMYATGAFFVAAQKKHNINARYFCAHAIHESNWGKSAIAQAKNNLFGFQAYDSSPLASARTFDSFEHCIDFVADYISRHYLTPGGRWYNGATLRGMNVHYATDPLWGQKIANLMMKIPEVKNLHPWQTKMGEAALGELASKGLVANPEDWKNQLGDPPQNWLFFTMMQRLANHAKADTANIFYADTLKKLFPTLNPAVVKVHKVRTDGGTNSGSGTFLLPDGTILTNQHVTDGHKTLTVEMHDGKKYPATFIRDSAGMMAEGSSVDLALIKVAIKPPAIIQLANIQPEHGQFCVVVGSPLGRPRTITFGIVSNPDDRHMYHVDAAINPGNSGGGCFDLDGRLIGVPTLKFVGSGIDSMGLITSAEIVKLFLERG